MKRLIMLILALVLALSICPSCKDSSDSPSDSSVATVDGDDDTDDDSVDDDDDMDDDDDGTDDDDDTVSGSYDFTNLDPVYIIEKDSIQKLDFDLDSQNRAGACYISNQTYFMREDASGQFTHEAIAGGDVIDCAFFFDSEDHPYFLFGYRNMPPHEHTLVLKRGDGNGNWSDWLYSTDDFNFSDAYGGVVDNTPFFVTEGSDRYVFTFSGGSWAVNQQDTPGMRHECDFTGDCGRIQGLSEIGTDPGSIMLAALQANGTWIEEEIVTSNWDMAELRIAVDSSCEAYATGRTTMNSVSDDDDDSSEGMGKDADSTTLELYYKNSGQWQTQHLSDNSAQGDILVDDNGQIYIEYGHASDAEPPDYTVKIAVGTPGNLQTQVLYDPTGEVPFLLEMMAGTDLKLRTLLAVRNMVTTKDSLVYLRPTSK